MQLYGGEHSTQDGGRRIRSYGESFNVPQQTQFVLTTPIAHHQEKLLVFSNQNPIDFMPMLCSLSSLSVWEDLVVQFPPHPAFCVCNSITV